MSETAQQPADTTLTQDLVSFLSNPAYAAKGLESALSWLNSTFPLAGETTVVPAAEAANAVAAGTGGNALASSATAIASALPVLGEFAIAAAAMTILSDPVGFLGGLFGFGGGMSFDAKERQFAGIYQQVSKQIQDPEVAFAVSRLLKPDIGGGSAGKAVHYLLKDSSSLLPFAESNSDNANVVTIRGFNKLLQRGQIAPDTLKAAIAKNMPTFSPGGEFDKQFPVRYDLYANPTEAVKELPDKFGDTSYSYADQPPLPPTKTVLNAIAQGDMNPPPQTAYYIPSQLRISPTNETTQQDFEQAKAAGAISPQTRFPGELQSDAGTPDFLKPGYNPAPAGREAQTRTEPIPLNDLPINAFYKYAQTPGAMGQGVNYEDLFKQYVDSGHKVPEEMQMYLQQNPPTRTVTETVPQTQPAESPAAQEPANQPAATDEQKWAENARQIDEKESQALSSFASIADAGNYQKRLEALANDFFPKLQERYDNQLQPISQSIKDSLVQQGIGSSSASTDAALLEAGFREKDVNAIRDQIMSAAKQSAGNQKLLYDQAAQQIKSGFESQKSLARQGIDAQYGPANYSAAVARINAANQSGERSYSDFLSSYLDKNMFSQDMTDFINKWGSQRLINGVPVDSVAYWAPSFHDQFYSPARQKGYTGQITDSSADVGTSKNAIK